MTMPVAATPVPRSSNPLAHIPGNDGWPIVGNTFKLLRDPMGVTAEAYKTYTEMAPRDVDGVRGLARAFEMLGKNELARLYFKKASELEPGNEELRQALRRVAGAGPLNAPEPASAESKPKDDATGFWRIGLAGVCKARTVWWGRLIAIFLFGMGQLQAAFVTPKTMTERFPNIPPTFIFINMLLAGTASYIVFWGIPQAWGWSLLALCTVVTAVAATKTATER